MIVLEEVAASVSGKMSKVGDNGPLLSLLGMSCRAEAAESKVVLKDVQQQYLPFPEPRNTHLRTIFVTRFQLINCQCAAASENANVVE